MRRFLFLATLIATLPSVGHAQLTQMRATPDTRFGIELTKGFYDEADLSWYTSVVRGRFLLPVSQTGRLFADVGVSIAGAEGTGMDGTTTNPELGLVFVDEDDDPRGYLSIVVPVRASFGDDDISAGTGVLTDLFRLDRFVEEIVTVNAGFTPMIQIDEATDLTTELTAAAFIPTGDGDAELFARYGLGVRHTTSTVRLRGGIEGFAIVSEGDLSLGERTIHRLAFGVDGPNGGPGLFLQVPLSEELDAIRAVVGFTYAF